MPRTQDLSAEQLEDPDIMCPKLGLEPEQFENLRRDGYSGESLLELEQTLHGILMDVPIDMFIRSKHPKLGEVLYRGDQLIPIIPRGFGFVFFLQHISDIRAFSMKPWKKAQPAHLTLAIFQWRLDELHVMHRWNDSNEANILLFMALLAMHERIQNGVGSLGLNLDKKAVDFMQGYLKAVLESHNEPEDFSRRGAFVHDWLEHCYDFFDLDTATMHEVRKRLWQSKDAWSAIIENASEDRRRRIKPFSGSLLPEESYPDVLRGWTGHSPDKLAVLKSRVLHTSDVYRKLILDALKEVNKNEKKYIPEVISTTSTVCDVPTALLVLQKVEAEEMLSFIVDQFSDI
jgi:hypothetical protein